MMHIKPRNVIISYDWIVLQFSEQLVGENVLAQ